MDEIDTREQQLLQSRALLLHMLKTLHSFMASRITGDAENTAFYAYDTNVVHENVLRHLTDSLAQLTDFENIIRIDKFITDVASYAQDAELEVMRQTMCALFAFTATSMAWPMHNMLRITAVAMNAFDASVCRLLSAPREASNTIPGVREL